MAFPEGDLRAGLKTVSLFNGYTPARRVARMGLRVALGLRLHRLIARPQSGLFESVAGLTEQEFRAAVEPILPRRMADFTIFWPLPLGRRERLYLQVFDAAGERMAFVKLALEEGQNALLAREAEILPTIGSWVSGRFEYPRLLGSGMVGEHAFLAISPLPDGTAPIAAEEMETLMEVAQEKLKPRQAAAAEIFEAPWWAAFKARQRGDSAALRFLERVIDDRGLLVSPVHGDFGPHNALRQGDRIWLIDWERGSFAGPRWTDRASLAMSLQPKERRGRPAETLDDVDAAVRAHGGSAGDVAAALAYLSTVGSREAANALALWPS